MEGAHSFCINGSYYPVFTGDEALRDIEIFVASSYPSSKIFILTDANVRNDCLPLLLEKCPFLKAAEVWTVPPGENSKDIFRVVEIWNWLTGLDAERLDLLINLGGGVVTDLGGFVAGTYKRGIPHINIPTSLVGQADASMGGKTGINVASVKNQAGLFNNPLAVFLYPSFLKTLPERELKAGYAEIIKSALITGGEFWERVLSPGLSWDKDLQELIIRSARAKLVLTDKDPMDLRERRALNFGHTVGHALESLSFRHGSNTILHGEAVAAGMACESDLSVVIAGLEPTIKDSLERLLGRFFHPADISENDVEEILHFILQDKKNREGKIGVTLVTAPGQVLTDHLVPLDQIRQVINNYRIMFGK